MNKEEFARTQALIERLGQLRQVKSQIKEPQGLESLLVISKKIDEEILQVSRRLYELKHAEKP